MDVGQNASQANQEHGFALKSAPASSSCGRFVDAAPRCCRLTRRRKELISRNFLKPSDGLEPSTPSLPSETIAAGCDRLPIGLFEPFSGLSHLRPVATGCAR